MRLSAALLLLFAACSASPDHEVVTIDTLPSGVVRVVNHGPSEWADTNGWKLELDHTIQPGEGEPGEFGRPGRLHLLEDGRVLVRDNKPVSLRLYGRDGHLARAIGRDGAGPGEYRSPALNAFGDTIFVWDATLAKAIAFDTLGAILLEFATPPAISNGEVPVDDTRRIYLGTTKVLPGTYFGQTWIRLTLRGEVVDTAGFYTVGWGPMWSYNSADGRSSAGIGVPFAASTRPVALRNGTFLFPTGNAPVFTIRAFTGDTLRVVVREGRPAVVIDGALRDSIFEQTVAENEALRAVAKRAEIPLEYAAWRALYQDGTGDLWFLADDGQTPPSRFDVFSADGVLRGSVPVPTTSKYPSYSFAGDRVAILDTDEGDLPRVRVYRIVRK